MTPEEKAKELIEKFEPFAKHNGFVFYEQTTYAKKCALICVEEVMIFHPVANNDERSKKFNEYWQSVKKSIKEKDI